MSIHNSRQAEVTAISFSLSGIQDLTLARCRPFDRAWDFFPPKELLRSRHHDVLWDLDALQGEADLHLLLPPGTEVRHHDEQIDVAFGSCIASCVRAEEDDFLRMKLAHDPAHHLPDLFSFIGTRVAHLGTSYRAGSGTASALAAFIPPS